MITAKNYALNAAKDIESFSSVIKSDYGENIDYINMIVAAEKIRKAVHFVVPDGGVILNDGLRGIKREKVYLPYKLITIEYFYPPGPLKRKDWACEVNKRLILAEQGDGFIRVMCVYYIKHYQRWILWPIFYDVNTDWNNPEGLTGVARYDDIAEIDQKKAHLISTKAVGVFLPAIFNMFSYSLGGVENARKSLSCDIGSDVVVMLEMLEALTCKNVTEGIYQKRILEHSRGVKRPKVKFFETKMLVVDADKNISGNKYLPSGKTHASPRQHLRRGHIRRLSSGNIWVNSCVVGDPTKGMIAKQYAVV